MEIAGVMTHSPIIREIPKVASRVKIATLLGFFRSGSSIPFRTRVPPSSVSDNRIARIVYWIVTMIISVQKIRDTAPMIFSVLGEKKKRSEVYKLGWFQYHKYKPTA
jgi:hypothetical protein